ncbi:hypothetical protein IV102_16855 [bacterium]|nr:hypothetical protein [bacterium]
MKAGNRGLGVIELLFALGLMVTAVFTLLSVFTSSSRHAVMSRNRTVAILVCHNMLDECKAHPFGRPAPKIWSESRETPVTVYVEGRPQEMEFKKTVTYANGSFVGKTAGDSDEVTIKVEWKEGAGPNNGHKEMSVKVPVWR